MENPKSLPCFTCAEVRGFDRYAIEELGISGAILMENAGRVLTETLLSFMKEKSMTGPILILAGPGNNGGDGFVMARHLQRLGQAVRLIAVGKPGGWKGEAGDNLAAAEKLADQDLTVSVLEKDSPDLIEKVNDALQHAGLVVDALLGTGVTGAPRAPFERIIEAVNAAGKPVFAVDIPSGLNGDTGEAAQTAIRAAATCTLAALKQGLVLPEAAEYTGKLSVGDIGVALEKLSRR